MDVYVSPMFLPPTKFFRPKGTFLSFMYTNFKGRKIYDVGAGLGHVSKALNTVGLNVTAFDFNLRKEMEYPVGLGNGMTYNYESGSVVMFCRPSHGCFVEESIERAIECGVSDFLYVGLSPNTKPDLGKHHRDFKNQLRNAGFTREGVWVYQKRTK